VELVVADARGKDREVARVVQRDPGGLAHEFSVDGSPPARRGGGCPEPKGAGQATPSPGGAAGAALFGVSCTSGSSCLAVGTTFNGAGSPAGLFSEQWDGASWHLTAAPMPAGSANSFFAGVACTSPSSCTAVGARTDSAGNPIGTLAEQWNGSSWSIQSTPNPAPGGVLAGVSCTSAVACTAAGNLNQTAHAGTTTLVERWNGTNWAIQPTPRLSAGQGSFFNGVACQAGACTAVGLYLTNSGPLTLAERWTGARWLIQATPNPGAAFDLDPPAVACPSVSACLYVGGYTNNGPKLTLAEQWNGSGQTALPAGSRSAAPGGAPSACLRTVLPAPLQGWRRAPAAPPLSPAALPSAPAASRTARRLAGLPGPRD